MDFIQNIDNSVILFIKDNLLCDFFDVIMPFISSLGNLGFIWIVIGIYIVLFSKKYRNWGIVLIVALAVTTLTGNGIIKNLVDRIRPYDNLMLEIIIKIPHGSSFPSGHTGAAFTAAAVMIAFNKKIGMTMVVFAVIMGFSRLYLLVHYPSDVICGAILGLTIGSLVVMWFRKIKFIN